MSLHLLDLEDYDYELEQLSTKHKHGKIPLKTVLRKYKEAKAAQELEDMMLLNNLSAEELNELKFGDRLKKVAKKVGTHFKNHGSKYVAAGATLAKVAFWMILWS